MTTLIAMLSSGKGTWGQVTKLITCQQWEKVILVCNEFAYDSFDIPASKATKVLIDDKLTDECFRKLSEYFKKEIKDLDVAVNIISGSGYEHMILISSILKAGLGIRFVFENKGEVNELEILDEKYVPEEEYF